MKKFATSLTAIAALVGVGGALAFTPKAVNPKVFATLSGTTFSYTSTQPANPFSCQLVHQFACTLSTTATANFFNTHNASVFPTASTTPGAPVVIYEDAGSIYQ